MERIRRLENLSDLDPAEYLPDSRYCSTQHYTYIFLYLTVLRCEKNDTTPAF